MDRLYIIIAGKFFLFLCHGGNFILSHGFITEPVLQCIVTLFRGYSISYIFSCAVGLIDSWVVHIISCLWHFFVENSYLFCWEHASFENKKQKRIMKLLSTVSLSFMLYELLYPEQHFARKILEDVKLKGRSSQAIDKRVAIPPFLPESRTLKQHKLPNWLCWISNCVSVFLTVCVYVCF